MRFGKSLMRKRVICSSLLVVKNGEYWVCGNKIKWTEFRETAWLACPVGFRRWKKTGHHTQHRSKIWCSRSLWDSAHLQQVSFVSACSSPNYPLGFLSFCFFFSLPFYCLSYSQFLFPHIVSQGGILCNRFSLDPSCIFTFSINPEIASCFPIRFLKREGNSPASFLSIHGAVSYTVLGLMTSCP